MSQDPETRLKSRSKNQELILQRYLQNLHSADSPEITPLSPPKPLYHTGKVSSSKNDGKPRLLLMGQRRSGKSSISGVVFHKLPPSETLYLETTTRITKDYMHSFMDFQVWDCPAHVNYFDPQFDVDSIFGEIGALIWVIDAQDEYYEAIGRLLETIIRVHTSYPSINIEVFVHKVDGLAEDIRMDVYQEIQQRVQDELSDASLEMVPVSWYLTSIFDHSIFEAFSKVIQKLIPQLPTLENLLTALVRNCGMEKAYLFDVLSKIYIATDATPTDLSSYEVCSDYIDLVVDISEIYGWDRPVEEDIHEYGNEDAESLITTGKNGNTYLYMREINRYLALICIMGKESTPDKKPLIDYNVRVFQNAVSQVFHR